MCKLIDLFEIDQFAYGAEIPKEAVTDAVISGVRQLDEVTELEPALREILGAPDETPHGPTELEDIFQTGVLVKGKPSVAAFIIKGKSFKTVTSRKIGNQILRLQDVPDLGLAVLCAVGHIHDDAKRDFIRIAKGRNANYLVLDAMLTARLLIGYEKICPKDGTPYNKNGFCRNGHQKENGTIITWRVNEGAEIEYIHLIDNSTTRVKRYTAFLLTDKHYSREVIRRLIVKATEQLKSETYQRPGVMRKLWSQHQAQVVWVFVAKTVEDSQLGHWLCRTVWIDPALSEHRPSLLGGEMVDGVEFVWNPDYRMQVDFVAKNKVSKGVVMQLVEQLFYDLIRNADLALSEFKAFDEGVISELELAGKLQPHYEKVRQLVHQCSDIPFGPVDTTEVVQLCISLGASMHEMFNAYSIQSMKDRTSENRRILFESAFLTLSRDLKRWEVAVEKVHHR